MHTDIYGQQIFDELDLCDLYMIDPNCSPKRVLVRDHIQFNSNLGLMNIPETELYINPKQSVEEFDKGKQTIWYMPFEYINFDIAKWVLSQCNNEAELQRAGDELIKFLDREMFPLLQYLKYLVDTMRKHNVVWGVGRGSSTASFVLFLIGVHRINSIEYDLSIDEFLK